MAAGCCCLCPVACRRACSSDCPSHRSRRLPPCNASSPCAVGPGARRRRQGHDAGRHAGEPRKTASCPAFEAAEAAAVECCCYPTCARSQPPRASLPPSPYPPSSPPNTRRPSSPRRWALSWTRPPCWATRAAAGARGRECRRPPAPACLCLPACCPTPAAHLSCSLADATPPNLLHSPPRSFSAVVEGGALKALNLEEGGAMTCSLSNQIIDQLKA